jgi:hypothetical protein
MNEDLRWRDLARDFLLLTRIRLRLRVTPQEMVYAVNKFGLK